MNLCINSLNLQNHLGGIGWYCYYLVKFLKKQDPTLSITLLTHAKAAPLFYPLKEFATIKEVKITALWLKVLYAQFILPFILKNRFDEVHSIGNIGLLWCPIPQIITIHDTYEKVSPQRFSLLKRVLMSAMISISGKNAAGIIAVSQNTFNDVARFYPHLKNKTKVIYSGNKFNAEDYVYYKPLDQFLFVGTIEPGKNLSTVLKALSIFNQGSKKTKLKVIGAQGWKQSHLFQLIKDLGLIDSVIFCGYASDEQLKKEYQSSIALICASLYEGFGLPVIEAMACGCPVIAANNSSLPEAGAECAMYFETENEKDLAEKMLLLTVHPEMTNNNIQAGLVHASKFTWEKTARQTCELYWEIVGKKGEKS